RRDPVFSSQRPLSSWSPPSKDGHALSVYGASVCKMICGRDKNLRVCLVERLIGGRARTDSQAIIYSQAIRHSRCWYSAMLSNEAYTKKDQRPKNCCLDEFWATPRIFRPKVSVAIAA